MTVRRPLHAGSWYSESDTDLLKQLGDLVESVEMTRNQPTKAIIAPHAGYRYSGTTASWAYASLNPSQIERVFILGPCHHTYIDGCAVPDTNISEYATPFGNLAVDVDIVRELKAAPEVAFKTFKLADDEEEHSIEMQLPFLHYILRSAPHVKIVPIYVGSIVQNEERVFGRVLSKYLDDPATVFVISSDFCHWGHRFRFTPNEFPHSKPGCIFAPESVNGRIEALDRQGMELIARQDTEGFSKYLQTTGNTICGKNPILIFMEMLRNSRTKHQVEFVHYSQSNELPLSPSRDDSCVSYAAGVCYSVS
jgi:AmmeMemoRadiSam system protein B